MELNPQLASEHDPRKGRGRPDLWQVTDAAIAHHRLTGLTIKEIAKLVGLRSQTTVRVRLAKMGFPKRLSRFCHGKPNTGRAILDFREDFDLIKRDLVKVLKLEQQRHGADSNGDEPLPAWLAESIYRQSINSKIDEPLGIEVADALLRLRRKLIEKFCIWDSRHGRQKVRHFLKSEIRDLRQLRPQLKESLAQIYALPEIQAGGDNPPQVFLSSLCEKVRKEVAYANGNCVSGQSFRMLMFFWPTLEVLYAANPSLLSGTWRIDDAVDAILASAYNATPYRVRCAAAGKVEPLDARTLGQRVRESIAPAVLPKQKKHGRQTDPATKHRITIAAGCKLQRLGSRQMSSQLFPEQTIKANAVDSTKKFLKRQTEQIGIEQARLLALPDADRAVSIQAAKQRLAALLTPSGG